MSMLDVIETHLTESGQMVLDEVKGYTILLSGRQDGKAAEVSACLCSTGMGCITTLPGWVPCL